MDKLKKLDRIVDDWLRQVEPHAAAATVAHVLMRNAQENPEWCEHLIYLHAAERATGGGLTINDMLSFGLMIITREL